MEGSLSACWMTCSGFRLRYDHIAKVVQSRMANYFQISPPLVFSYRLSFSPTTESYRLEFEFEESLPRKTASIFKEGIGHESNETANQEKQIFLLCQISPSASSTRDLGTRLCLSVKIAFHPRTVKRIVMAPMPSLLFRCFLFFCLI